MALPSRLLNVPDTPSKAHLASVARPLTRGELCPTVTQAKSHLAPSRENQPMERSGLDPAALCSLASGSGTSRGENGNQGHRNRRLEAGGAMEDD